MDVARRQYSEHGDSHWLERAGALVAPLMHGCSLMGESLPQLGSRVDARHSNEITELLSTRYGEAHPAVTLLQSVLLTEERERSSIWSTASGLFAGIRTEAARQSARRPPIDLAAFFARPHQLHIVAPSQHQNVTIPLIVGLIEEMVNYTYRHHHDGAQLLLALDELANVAPLPRLASIVSEGGGQGVITLACLQDLSQARLRWGSLGDSFLSLFPTSIILPGIADRRTLELIQKLAGTEWQHRHVTQHTRRGRIAGHSAAWHEHERLTLATVSQGRQGYAMALTPTKEVRWIELTPAYTDPRFRTRLSAAELVRQLPNDADHGL